MKTKIDKVDKLKDGVCKEYFKNGSLSCEGVYAKGEKTGEWKYYLLNGKLKAIGKYENGKMTGEWKWYRENGELMQTGFLRMKRKQAPGKDIMQMEKYMMKENTPMILKLVNGKFMIPTAF